MGRRGDTWHNSSLTLASRSISTYINSPDMLYVCIYSTFYTVAAARLGELCSGDIDITTPPPTRAKHEPTLEACCCCFFLRRVFKMSDGPILVRLRRNQSGSQWGFTMQGGYDQGSCLYIQKVRNRVYTTYSFGNTIFVHIGESDLVLFHQLRVQGHNWNRVFKNIFINLLPRLYIIILGPPVATLQCTPLTWQLYLHLYMSVSFRDIDPIETRGSSRGFNR